MGSSDPYEAIRKTRKGKPRLEQWVLIKTIHTMLKNSSWKTSVAGIGAILGAVGTILVEVSSGGENGKLDTELVLGMVSLISAGVGNLFSKDKDKTNAPHPGTTKPAD